MNQLSPIDTSTAETVHRLDIERTRWGRSGARYRVTYRGQVLLDGSRSPIFDACRELQARGITGLVESYLPGATFPGMRLDIAKGATLMVREGQKQSPSIATYKLHWLAGDSEGADE